MVATIKELNKMSLVIRRQANVYVMKAILEKIVTNAQKSDGSSINISLWRRKNFLKAFARVRTCLLPLAKT